MRRPRHKLQVSTFPFLAVLLCTMGSLILLLLVIDRRARVVARAKALQAARQAEAENHQEVEARKAEWERRRLALHAALERQDQELRGQIRAVTTEAESASQQIEAEQERRRNLAQRLNQEAAELARTQGAVSWRRAEIAQTARMSEAERAELARMNADLEQLERALADLKAQRQKAPPLYSVVPYRGRHGDNRKPIYVECAAAGLIFHPERVQLNVESDSEIRAETERRIARQRSAADKKAYLLLLIRPNGIASYYHALNALDGLDLDFGYEFIDREWALDFEEGARGEGRGASGEKRVGSGQWAVGRNQGSGVRGQGSGISGSQPAAPAREGVIGSQPAAPTREGVIGSQPAAPARGDALHSGLRHPPAAPAKGEVGGSQPAAPARGDTPASGLRPPVSGLQHPPAPQTKKERQGSEEARGTQNAGQETMITQPAAPARGNRPQPEEARGTQNAGQESAETQHSALAPRPSPLAPRHGSRDWTITIECTAEGVFVRGNGQKIAVEKLSGDGTKHPLLVSVRTMIERRQASVPAGVPPYRPMIRFLVRPNGLRAYYLAYPALEALRLPMTRENVEDQ